MKQYYCQCGCGMSVGLAKWTDKRYGTVKGQPLKYISGHSCRSNKSKNGTRLCFMCKRNLPYNAFWKSKRALDGRVTYCKECAKKKERGYRLKREYKITVDDYEKMRLSQNDACYICHSKEKKLHIDHCHETGKVRGLLCSLCNTGLGSFKDNPIFLQNALQYLELNERLAAL